VLHPPDLLHGNAYPEIKDEMWIDAVRRGGQEPIILGKDLLERP